jgi:hypothetical protein
MRRLAPLSAVLLALGAWGLGTSARADVINFNPGGTGAPGVAIKSFDEAVGNAVAVSAAPQAPGTPFELFYQAVITSYTDANGNVVSLTGGNTQFTIVAGFQEQITSIGPGPNFTFAFVPGGNNYLEIYANTTGSNLANNSTGTGFNTGTLILSGKIFSNDPSIGNFQVNSPTPVKFDQFDNPTPPVFANTLTTVGGGQTTISAQVTSVDSNYFISPPQIFALNFRTSNGDPFTDVSPSQAFVQGPGGPGVLYVPNLGAINGVSGPDVQFQADASNSFTVAPEPTGMTLLGIGLATTFLGGATLRRKRTA